jgi:glycosyltransferase involved in cell wall biosynthesis
MIPTYNCDDRFEQTLRSVLDQDPGSERMQIEIVDDSSTSHRHEEIVRRLSPSRVVIHRQSSNVGLAANWNTCIARSRGQWVHILHQDDLVLPGFYERLAHAAERPDIGAAFCRHNFIDGEGRRTETSFLERPTAGMLADWLRTISRMQRVHCPAIAVRRDVYEHLGGFRADLCFALDWEMWVRIAASYPVWFEPEPLACYRIHQGNETARLQQEGRDLADVRKALRIIQGHLAPGLRHEAGRTQFAHSRDAEIRAATLAFSEGYLGRGMNHLHRAFTCDPALRFSRLAFSYYKWAFKITLRRFSSHITRAREHTS